MLGTIKILIALAGMFSAYKLGQMVERPADRWPGGTLQQGGWAAWRPIAMGLVGVSLLLQIVGSGMGMGGGMFGRGGGMMM